MTRNSTAYASTRSIQAQIKDAAYGAQVDLDGCETTQEVREALKAQCPQMLLGVLPGHGSHDPTLGQWLNELDNRDDLGCW